MTEVSEAHVQGDRTTDMNQNLQGDRHRDEADREGE
jgi:hypothetical protein